MSLFHSPRDRRLMSTRKRKRSAATIARTEVVIAESFPCEMCDTEYDSETELHLHRYYKHKNAVNKLLAEEFTCKICIIKQESREDLLKHIKTQHLLSSEDADYVEREIFICDFCHLLYFNKQMLLSHIMYSHNPVSKEKMTMDCPKCCKVIQIKQVWFHFQRHMIQSVSCCPICLKKCNSRRDLSAHLKEHPPYYHCNLCGYDSKMKAAFATHMKIHKKGYSSFKDALVSQCFVPTRAVRRNHYNFGLRGLQLYTLGVCILCRALCTEDSAADHVRLHLVGHLATKKEYGCVCGETFFNTVLLKHHVFKLKGDHRASDVICSSNQS